MNVRVHIERVVLEGIDLPLHERPLFQATLEAELGRLIAEGGVSPELTDGGAVPAVRGGGIQMDSEGGPGRLGQRVARAVYGGIGE